ncbi:MAG: CDP-alcohol phosphatidyltransferase family protein [Anaerolineae bacterium]|nr:CDP-alcohol phosphatidyltransferase family protein [Anaerolineae bacterium]
MEPEATDKIPQEKPTLTDVLRKKTVGIIDPVVTFLAKYHVSPDLLTVVGMLAHFFLAYLVAIGEMRWAGIAMVILAPLDALDGSLARKLGRKQGGFGAFLDSTLDRLAEIILFGGFIAYYLKLDDSVMLGLSYLAITGSLMVSYSRGKAESLGMEAKVGIGSRVERYVLMMILLILDFPSVAVVILAFITYITVGQRMFHVWKQYGRLAQQEEPEAAQTEIISEDKEEDAPADA